MPCSQPDSALVTSEQQAEHEHDVREVERLAGLPGGGVPQPTARDRRRCGRVPLLWRIFLGNAVVLGVATTALVLTPVTVSFPAAERELVVLAAGLR